MSCNRRKFLGTLGGIAVAGPARAADRDPLRLALGYDNFAVRAMGWKAPALIDYAAKLKVDTLFITDFGAFEKMDEASLAEVKKKAADAGVKLYLGTWSICPSSVTFKDDWGTADEHLQLGIRAAKALGSPVLRVILGSNKDRLTPGGIEARIADTVAVLKRNRNRCVDAGVKVAVENHAGDMHSLELAGLVEDAGPDFVGVNLDSGNAVWTLERPIDNLENLGRYVLTTSLRDTAVWESEDGVTAQWTAMGEGHVDWKAYFARFAELCPHAPVQIETISGFNKELQTGTDEFWKAWPDGKPKGYDKFLGWAKAGKPREAWKPAEGADRKIAQQEYQRGEIERSIAFCRDTLHLGLPRP
ncbi:MAG: sugar phosphate isomerase/epimerase [Akkermansiaceae bacterium]|nr:sugar phosphate isomerase/epimerase [Akkermansiaceae bacterium]